MPRLRALFHFDVGELWVRTEELGSVFDIGAGSVRIALPGGDAAFVLAEDRHGDRDDPFTGSAIGRRLELGHEMVGVRIIQIAVDLDGDVRASDFDQPTPDAYTRGNAAWDAADAIAENALRRFMSWARVVGNQYWIALSTDAPKLTGISVLYDLEADARIPLSRPSRSIGTYINSPVLRGLAPIGNVIEAMSQGAEAPTPERLLADARAIHWPTFSGPDHQRSVLLAAIASEMKVKETLLAQASPEAKPLVEIITENPREVTQSVPQLLRATAAAVVGRSLFEDDRELWKQVDKLFTLRNRVAHRGHTPSEDEARKAVEAAVALFSWLSEPAPGST